MKKSLQDQKNKSTFNKRGGRSNIKDDGCIIS